MDSDLLVLPGNPVYDWTLATARPPRQGENIEGDFLAMTQGEDGLLYWVEESDFDELVDRAIEDPLIDLETDDDISESGDDRDPTWGMGRSPQGGIIS